MKGADRKGVIKEDGRRSARERRGKQQQTNNRTSEGGGINGGKEKGEMKVMCREEKGRDGVLGKGRKSRVVGDGKVKN